MEKFVGNTFFNKIKYPFIILSLISLLLLAILYDFSYTFSNTFLILLIIYFIAKSRKVRNAYKIENNSFTIKSFGKIKEFNIKELTDFYEKKEGKNLIYIFQFGNKKIHIYYDENMKEIIDFFYANHFEFFYQKKKQEYDSGKERCPESKRNKLLIHIIYGSVLLCWTVLCVILFLKDSNEYLKFVILFIMFWQHWFIELHRIRNMKKYFNNEGFHEKKYIIPYSEIKSIIKTKKKLLTLRWPTTVDYLTITTDVEEIDIEDNISCNISFYRYIQEKLKLN